MFSSSRNQDSYRNHDADAQAANLALVGLLFLFTFVVLFVFIGMSTEMATRSDLPPTASVYQGGRSADPGTTGGAPAR
jgi:hypothetical protein